MPEVRRARNRIQRRPVPLLEVPSHDDDVRVSAPGRDPSRLRGGDMIVVDPTWCDLCGARFLDEEEAELHKRVVHPELRGRRAEGPT